MKKLFLAAIVCFSLCLSACSSDAEDTQSDVLSAETAEAQTESTVNTNDIAVYKGIDAVLQGSDRADDFRVSDFSDDELLELNNKGRLSGFGDSNFVINLPETDTKLGVINVNGVDVDISGITLGDFLDTTSLKQCVYAATDLQFADYEFISGMYGIQSDESDPFSFGSLMSVEIIDNDGRVVHNNDDIMNDNRDCTVKGICTSDFFMNGDFDVIFYEKIKCGMTMDEVYAALGGEEFADEDTFYAGECFYLCGVHQVLVILPRHGVADKIMLLNT